jgi:beta-N-acetylglucosaminidase
MHDEVQESREANQQVLAMLKDVRNTQEKQNQALQISFKKKHEAQTQKNNIMLLKSTGLHEDMDLKSYSDISVEDMDKIINYYDSMVNGGTRFKGKGYVFVEAAKETGLNPIYLFAHASCESAYGNSYLARTRGNYFGINAVDSNPDRADSMGDSVDEGIINGAKWIESNFYKNGYTTLESMHNAGYASGASWSKDIQSIANDALAIL